MIDFNLYTWGTEGGNDLLSTSQGYVVRPHLKKRKEKSTDENTRLHFDRCTSFPKCFHFPNCPLFLSSHVDFIAFLTFYLFIFFLLFLVLKKKSHEGWGEESECLPHNQEDPITAPAEYCWRCV